MKVSPKQRQVLDSLAVYGGSERVWARPMDLGARDGSFHSGVLRVLIDKKLVERELRNTLLNHLWQGRAGRGSYVYRLTEVGWDLARALRTTLYFADSSWHSHSNGANSGRRYHRPSDADEAIAFCSSRIVLNDDIAITIAELVRQGQQILICRRCVPQVPAISMDSGGRK